MEALFASVVGDKTKLQTLGENARKLGLPDAKRKIADLIVALAQQKH